MQVDGGARNPRPTTLKAKDLQEMNMAEHTKFDDSGTTFLV